jgi:glycosyltransferase involved in cell wall biosynthesis
MIGEPLRRRLGRDHLIGLERALADFDIVHAAETFLGYTFQAARAKERYGFKLVSTCWETIPFQRDEDPLTRWRKQYVRRHADIFLAMSPRAAEALRVEGVDDARIRVQFPGINLQHFRPLPRAGTPSVGPWQHDDKLRLLFVGRVIASKGLRDLILAAAEIARIPRLAGRVELGLVGNGDATLIHHMAASLGLHGAITHIPALPYASMTALYASADVFVLPSLPTPWWEEQFGMVLAESMACGKAVVSTHSGAIPEVVGDAGMLVPPYDYKALAQAIGDLLMDDQKRSCLGARAATRARALFDSEVFASRVHGLYEELLA